LNYRGASLSQGETSLSTKLQPGDRAPDAPLLDHQQNPLRLFDLLRGPHFTLLEFTSDGGEQTLGGDESLLHHYKILRTPGVPQREGQLTGRESQLTSNDQHIWNSYGVESDALFLIRPDGYIGFLGPRESATQVEAYLRGCTAPKK
jgi:hypothetical protein